MLRVFRDKTSLSLTPALWRSIENALSNSEYFILMASPDAAASQWVQQEVDYWLEHRSPEKIFLIWTAGTLAWDRSTRQFLLSGTTALPASLLTAFIDEPLYLDLRWARSAEHLSLQNPRFRESIADIAAPLHGLPKDELIGEDVRQYKRAKRLLWSGVTALVVLTLTVFVAAYQVVVQKNNVEAQRNVAMSRMLALESLSTEDEELARRLSFEALRTRDTVEARKSLVRNTSLSLGQEFFSYLCCAQDAVSALAFVGEGKRLFAGDLKGYITEWSLNTEAASPLSGPLEGKVLLIGTGDGEKGLVAVSTDQVALLQLGSGPSILEPIDKPISRISSAALSDDGRYLAVGGHKGQIAVWDLKAKSWFPSMVDENLRRKVLSIAFHPDGKTLVASYGIPPVPGGEQPISRWDIRTGERAAPTFIGHQSEVMSLDFSADARWLASGSWDQDIRIWDVDSGKTLPPVIVRSAQELDSIRPALSPTLVAISPDGEIVGSVIKNTVALWDLSNHKNLAQFTGLIRGTTLAFDLEGRFLAIGGEDKNVLMIPTGFDSWLRAACDTAPRPLTDEEKRYYLGELSDESGTAAWISNVYTFFDTLFGQTSGNPGDFTNPCK